MRRHDEPYDPGVRTGYTDDTDAWLRLWRVPAATRRELEAGARGGEGDG